MHVGIDHGQVPGPLSGKTLDRHFQCATHEYTFQAETGWRATMVASHEISIFLRLLADLETNPDTHIHNHIHKCIAILAVLHLSLNELSSLVLLVSFVARRDAAHGQHYGSTIWKSGVG